MRRLTRGAMVTSGLLAVILAGGGVAPAAAAAPPLRVARVHDLGTLGGLSSAGLQINERGQVLGTSSTAEEFSVPFFWDGALHRVTVPGWPGVTAAALNDRGQVAGTASDATGRTRAFVWQRGHARVLGTLGGTTSSAADVNDLGHVAGTSTRRSGPEHAFLWRGGRLTDLGTLGGAWSRAVALNNCDQVIGESETADGRVVPFLWSRGRMRELESLPQPSRNVAIAINDRGDVLGQRQDSGPNADMEAVVWPRTGGVVVVGLFQPNAINDHGDVVGQDVFEFFAFRWRNGVLSRLTDLGFASAALAVNDRGIAAGYSDIDRAAVWDLDGTVLDLGTLGGPQALAQGINNRNQVVGTAKLADDSEHAVVWDLTR